METLEMLEDPPEEWAEEHKWCKGDEFELRVPRDDSPRAMLLPKWGWVEVIYRYRLTRYVGHAETIDRLDADVFEGPGGRVLVVEHFDGFDDHVRGDCGDYFTDRGARVWEAPSRVAEPPKHLVDIGSHVELEDWLVHGVAPMAARWGTTTDLHAHGLIKQASIIEPDEVADWLTETSERFYEDVTFGWSSRDIEVADAPRLIVHFPSDRYRQSDRSSWAFAYDGSIAGQEFMLMLFFERSGKDEPKTQGQVVWQDEVERAISAKGEENGLVWLLGQHLFDVHADTLQTSIPF